MPIMRCVSVYVTKSDNFTKVQYMAHDVFTKTPVFQCWVTIHEMRFNIQFPLTPILMVSELFP